MKYFGVLFLSICPFICFASDSFIEGDIDYSDGKIYLYYKHVMHQYPLKTKSDAKTEQLRRRGKLKMVKAA